jgi:hypothetical protein
MRAWYERTGIRPLSSPFLSGDGFRALAHREFVPSQPGAIVHEVRSGDRVFCRGDWLRTFLEGPAGKIPVPFSIISHNDDTTVTQDWAPLLPPNLVRLFAQNAVIVDPRVVPLPIGLENASKHYNGVVSDYRKLRRREPPHRNRILYAFTDGTNSAVRTPARRALEHNPLADGYARTNSRTYRKVACQYRFIASPPGNGVDCHRTWEALYLRSIPIVVRSPLTESFARVGIPLWQVETYSELEGLTEEDLAQKYESFTPGLECLGLWEDYWKSLVLAGSSV